MSSFMIATCSTADLPPSYAEQHELLIMRYSYTIDHTEYKDGDMDAKTFFDLERNGVLPTTSQLTPQDIMQFFEGVLSEGKDLLYIAFSSGLSGSCNNVNLVAGDMKVKYPDRKIHVIDSLSASQGQGLLVDYAIKMRDAGKSIDEIANWLESNKLGLNHWFTVDNLSHLHRGGRVTGAAAFVGNLLHIKPVLNVDHEGHLIPREKEQGRKRALKCLVEKMEEYVYKPKGQTIFINHGDDLEAAEKLAGMVRKRFPEVGEIKIFPLGTVIGAHSGPGTVSVFFMGKTR